jgi:hypothetical protein
LARRLRTMRQEGIGRAEVVVVRMGRMGRTVMERMEQMARIK